MRKIASFVIGLPASLFWKPTASAYTRRPLRATSTTTPGRLPLSISCLKASLMRPSRCADIPTDSGDAAGNPCASSCAAAHAAAAAKASDAMRFSFMVSSACILIWSATPRQARLGGLLLTGHRGGDRNASNAVFCDRPRNEARRFYVFHEFAQILRPRVAASGRADRLLDRS